VPADEQISHGIEHLAQEVGVSL